MGKKKIILTKKKKFLFGFIAFVIISIICLFIFELSLRILNPLGVKQRASWHFLLWEGIQKSDNEEKVWEHVRDYKRNLVGYQVAINSLGLRGDELPKTKAKNSFRILALGDSMTFGMSGKQNSCYPAQLQEMLSGKYPDNNMQVVNAGVLAYTTLQEEALLRELLPAVEPDLVILWWFHNDLYLTGASNHESQVEELRNQIGLKPKTWKRKILHVGYEIFPCTMALIRTLAIAFNEGDQTHFQFDPNSNPEGWKANQESLRRIVSMLKEKQIPIIIYTFGKYDEIEELCKRHDIPNVTSVETAGKLHEEKYAVHKADPHFNHEGNKLVAKTLFEHIINAPLF